MSDNENTEATEADASAKKGKKAKKGKGDKGPRSNLVPAVILAVGMLGAGYLLGPGSGDRAAASGPTTTEAPPVGEIAKVEPININLADGHFLRVGVGLQLVEGVTAAEFEKGPSAKASDLLIAELGGTDMSRLTTAEGREEAKKTLKQHLKHTYEGEVTDVFFTEFVMQ
ncbi:MAG: flagellar basal body-associated FliL family protein [Microthrixaceae bacterium]